MADDEDYNNTHRAFLQVFLAKGTLTFEEAKPILANIQTTNGKPFQSHVGINTDETDNNERETLPNDITEPDFNNYITILNSAISPFDLEIRSSLSQHDRTRIFALVNTTSDAITQLATTHSADEISFLKRVLDAMFETYNTGREEVMAVTSLQALKLARPPVQALQATQDGEMTQGAASQGLTKLEAERMLQSLVAEGWFELSRKGYYSLSPRALMELRGWLMETYNEADEEDEDEERVDRIKMCHACREIVTVVSTDEWGSVKSHADAHRVNDARTSNVPAGYTTSARGMLSGRSRTRRYVRYARLHGMASSS